MPGNGAKRRRWGPVLRYVFGGALGLLAVVVAAKGLPWYLVVVVVIVAIVVVLGRRRIFRAAVTRTADDEIVCRYVPWYEGDAYFVNVLLPLMGVAAIAGGYAPGYPVWLRYGGFLLLALTPLFFYSAHHRWHLSFVRITPSALTVRVPTPKKQEPIDIARNGIQSITPKNVPNGVGGAWLQVEIAYHTTDSGSGPTTTVLLGQQLSVRPANLYDALAAWREAAHPDPDELMDRIERILRGRPTVDCDRIT